MSISNWVKKLLSIVFAASLAATALPAISQAAGYIAINVPAPLPNAVVGQYYSATLSFANTTGYQVNAAVSGLPNGLTVVEQNNFGGAGYVYITGVPSSVGFYTVNVYLSNFYGESASQSFALTVVQDARFDVVTTSLPSGSAGSYYSANIHVLYSGTYAPNAYFSGLPPGISAGAIGIIPIGGYFDLPLFGTPTVGGIYNVSLFLDGTATSVSRNFTLTVFPTVPAPPLPPPAPFEPFSFSQRSFDFYYTIGSSEPAFQSLTFNNITGSPISYVLSLDSHPSWLNSAYNEYSTLISYPGSPTGLGAAVKPAGLSPGTYRANIYMTGNFSNSPLVIPIRLNVSGVLGTITPPMPPVPPPTPPLPTAPANKTALIRLYNAQIDNHFYTTDRGEALSAAYAGYRLEGDMGYVYTQSVSGTEPLYRMYSARARNHFYTTKADEVIASQRAGFVLEGIIGYVPTFSSEVSDKQIYRLFNARSGDHVYTVDDYERQMLMLRGYVWEGSLGGRDVNWLLAAP
ncbi:MAG: hypothetical protein A2751_00500 [Candidatus Doudnabacteria bacterium RIFCSPHIGHO2_01_FULL_46_14]|uniref:DUF5648 domain-containing protein n=1 Tax=Candidatus Doudnabacteria bacterium RIFCSPHIGHO2_01_FULL_46_14 TaxID=1817824 RepID=A0A1F5NPF2_9BACT|nr:MAG: hypothetical protein A2751_00500 [Candidatus Doudnabacteria bacterium RIFCSPHIGHO2_01_FULL_46_14]